MPLDPADRLLISGIVSIVHGGLELAAIGEVVTAAAGIAAFAAVAPLALGVAAVGIGAVAEFMPTKDQRELHNAFLETKEIVTAVNDPIGHTDEWILERFHQNTPLNREAAERAKDTIFNPPKP